MNKKYEKHILILTFFILCYPIVSFSQNRKKTDSLLKVLERNNLSITEKAILFETISYYHPKLDSALYFAKKALTLFIELKDDIRQAGALEEIGSIEQRLGNSTKSLQVIFKSLSIYERLNLVENQAALHTQIATHYVNEKEYTRALNYLEKSLTIYNRFNFKRKYLLTLVNLGEVYRLSGNLNKAESTFLKVLKLNQGTYKPILGYSFGNLGMVYASKNLLKEAKIKLNKAINILSDFEDYYSVSIYLAELGQVHKKEKKYNIAEAKLTQAFEMAKNTGLKEQIRDFSKMLVVLNKEKKDFEKAFNYQEIYQIYQDSLINKGNIKKIEHIKSEYEINKRETEIQRINEISTNRKNIAIGLAFGILLFAVLSYLLYKLYKHIQLTNIKLSKREEEKALLLKELNHRVKNNLQMISSLLNLQSGSLTQESAKQIIASGRERVEALSLVHKKLYQEGIETKVNVKDYVEELVLNLIDSYHIPIETKFLITPIHLAVDKAIPIALIINELVTNAIKYAYNGINSPKLRVLIEEKKEGLRMEVSDNGIGILEKEKNKVGSLGLKLILSLTEQLNGTLSTENNCGTYWSFIFRYNSNL